MKVIFRRKRMLILQDTWRVDWRTPSASWFPWQIVFTLRRWVE